VTTRFKGALIDPYNKVINFNALQMAVSKKHTNIVELLLNHDVTVDGYSKDGWTALLLASNNGCIDIVKLLLQVSISSTFYA